MAKTIGDLLENFLAARNRHDADGIMAFYAENIIARLAGFWQKNGKKAMQDMTEWEITLNPIYRVSHTALLKDKVRCRLVESNEWLRMMGIESVVYEPFLITIRDGKIIEINAEFAIDSYKKYQHAWTTITEWVKEKHPELYATLFEDDFIKYSKDAARQWRDLVQEYQKTR